MSRPRPRTGLMAALVGMLAGVEGAGRSALHHLTNAPPPPTFGMRYGGSPRSTGNGGQGRGNQARLRRAARKLRNVRARGPK